MSHTATASAPAYPPPHHTPADDSSPGGPKGVVWEMNIKWIGNQHQSGWGTHAGSPNRWGKFGSCSTLIQTAHDSLCCAAAAVMPALYMRVLMTMQQWGSSVHCHPPSTPPSRRALPTTCSTAAQQQCTFQLRFQLRQFLYDNLSRVQRARQLQPCLMRLGKVWNLSSAGSLSLRKRHSSKNAQPDTLSQWEAPRRGAGRFPAAAQIMQDSFERGRLAVKDPHRHDGQRIGEVRRVLQQPLSLVQGLEHQLQLPVVEVEHGFLKVPHPAVHLRNAIAAWRRDAAALHRANVCSCLPSRLLTALSKSSAPHHAPWSDLTTVTVQCV